MPVRPDVRFPSIEGLRAFEAAARLGTFERAADELSVTASAVSKRVAAVEELVGALLFSRSGKTLVPTPAGREYLEQVRAALGLLAAMPLHRRAVQRMTRLRVCAPPTFARQILVPALDGFVAEHPDVELEIVLSVPYLDAASADVDVEIRHGGPQHHGGDVLIRDVLLPMAAPALLAQTGPLTRPADLQRLRLLRTPLEPWTQWFAAAGLDWPEPARGARLVDLGLLLEAAVCGQGVALGRPSLARQWLRSGALVALFDVAPPSRTHYFLAPQPASLSETARDVRAAFENWLRAVCAGVEREAAELVSGAP
ncbi:LysR substrate-binding domain-containing protein [Azoarcus olearius]|uniref:Probable transcriptional regulator, LysR family n=1 Tax=Azoarcus sp. (strain BH72) TaxID=418699 RepID=A1K477_AZOSB|nr:LysR substrate-binding domain-containing protein [Azoarcus olearius]CAL93632.1 probable transcriptional regulator, LysR family [Azoarcus olearius]